MTQQKASLKQYGNTLCFILLFLFYCCLGRAQSEWVLSSSNLDTRLGSNWRGALFICDPYCRFYALKEENQWTPSLSNEKINYNTLSSITVTDPLYPLLITTSPIKDFVKKNAEEQSEQALKSKSVAPPAYVNMPFNFGWSIDAGPAVTNKKVTTNNAIQSEILPKESIPGIYLRLEAMSGKGQSIMDWVWFQHKAGISSNQGSSYFIQDATQGKSSAFEYYYQLWLLFPEFKTGPQIKSLSVITAFQNDSLSHSSNTLEAMTLAWSFLWKRWDFKVETAISSKIKDNQSFRTAPFEHNWYRLSLEKCSKDIKLFGLVFQLCGGGDYTMDSQKSAVAANLLSNSDSELKQNTTTLRTGIKIGDDLWQ